MLGLDFLGLLHRGVKIKKVAIEWPEGVALGVLLDSFNKNGSLKNLETVLATGKVPSVRAHLVNTTALRNKVCAADFVKEYGSIEAMERAIINGDKKLLSHLAKKKEQLEELCCRYNVKLLVSPFLEHNFSARTMKLLRTAFEFDVNNPMRGTQKIGEPVMAEGHGTSLRRGQEIHSLDGVDATAVRWARFQQAEAKKEIIFLWTHAFNLRDPKGRFVCPLERSWGTNIEWFISMREMLLAEPETRLRLDMPGIRTGKLGRKALWKTHDDAHGKPVAILPVKAREVEIMSHNGRKLGTMRYAGTWNEDKTFYRYYSARGGSGERGYELAAKSIKESGKPCVFLLPRNGSKAFRVPHPAQRWGFEYGKRKD